MALTIDDRTVRTNTCPDCSRQYEHVTGFVLQDGDAYAVYFAACHGHPEHEAWIDVVLGTWGAEDPDDGADHVTLSCQLRAEGAAAVDAPVAVEGTAEMFGTKLTRDQALSHDWLPNFWEVVDLVATSDPDVKSQVYV